MTAKHPNTDSAANIINAVSSELGLGKATDPFGSADPTFVQLVTLLNDVGEELGLLHDWQALNRREAFITDGVASTYALPDDLDKIINLTAWDRSNASPLGGAVSPTQYQQYQANGQGGALIHPRFRVAESEIEFLSSVPAAGQDINYEYQSTNWVVNSAGDYAKVCANAADTPVYHKTLVKRYLKLKWLEAKGFDTTKAQDNFNQVFTLVSGRDTPAGVLSLGQRGGYRYLDYNNIPDTNYGIS